MELFSEHVHLFHERGDASRVPTGEVVSDVVRRGDQERLEQLTLGEALAGHHIESRVTVLNCADPSRVVGCSHREAAPRAVAERVVLQHDHGGHDLGHARHRDRDLVRGSPEEPDSPDIDRRLPGRRDRQGREHACDRGELGDEGDDRGQVDLAQLRIGSSVARRRERT